ncbi:MAG: AbrB/MazE/SpoVT family DNA-binding domain-containing protein [Candidatus Nanohaloarchaea archaeon]
MTSVTEKGQVTIPKKIRQNLGIEPGDELNFEIDGDSLRVEKDVGENPFSKWEGYLDTGKTPEEIMRDLRGD